MNTQSRIYIAGGDTQLGQALRERLRRTGHRNLVGEPPDDPDLTHPDAVDSFFKEARPEYVFLTGGISGGIAENLRRPFMLMAQNILVSVHVINHAQKHGTRNLLYLGSSCAYPSEAPQPLKVESLLTGPPEATSTAFAAAKLVGWKLCEAARRQFGLRFITAIPANPFGPFDDFDPESGHVIPALIRRIHQAKQQSQDILPIWGTGKPRREFLYIHDLADACLFIMQNYNGLAPINIGSRTEQSIAETARLIADVVDYRGRLVFDPTKPDGAPRKILDSAPLRKLGWRAKTPFKAALEETYAWFLAHTVKEDAPHERATL